jgi:hypothetical protein
LNISLKRGDIHELEIYSYTRSFSVCTEFPEIWKKGAKRKTRFPVDQGTKLTVSCQKGFYNFGGDVITCNPYIIWDFEPRRQLLCLPYEGES